MNTDGHGEQDGTLQIQIDRHALGQAVAFGRTAATVTRRFGEHVGHLSDQARRLVDCDKAC